ncbi:MAG: hypothetical protein ABW189_02365 [Rickettsiales bacterium]
MKAQRKYLSAFSGYESTSEKVKRISHALFSVLWWAFIFVLVFIIMAHTEGNAKRTMIFYCVILILGFILTQSIYWYDNARSFYVTHILQRDQLSPSRVATWHEEYVSGDTAAMANVGNVTSGLFIGLTLLPEWSPVTCFGCIFAGIALWSLMFFTSSRRNLRLRSRLQAIRKCSSLPKVTELKDMKKHRLSHQPEKDSWCDKIGDWLDKHLHRDRTIRIALDSQSQSQSNLIGEASYNSLTSLPSPEAIRSPSSFKLHSMLPSTAFDSNMHDSNRVGGKLQADMRPAVPPKNGDTYQNVRPHPPLVRSYTDTKLVMKGENQQPAFPPPVASPTGISMATRGSQMLSPDVYRPKQRSATMPANYSDIHQPLGEDEVVVQIFNGTDCGWIPNQQSVPSNQQHLEGYFF